MGLQNNKEKGGANMGKPFNEIYDEDPQLAAGVLKNALIHLVNNYIPGIYLTKDQFKELIDIILAGDEKDPDEVNGTSTNTSPGQTESGETD